MAHESDIWMFGAWVAVTAVLLVITLWYGWRR